VTDIPAPAPDLPPRPAATPPPAAPVATSPLLPARWIAAGAALLAAVSAAALVFAWNTQQRVKALEAELVKRQQDSASVSTEALTLARQADVTARDAAARMALLDARVSETTMQRSQLEDLIQSLARSRDENVLADLEAAIRVALQQAAITGSAEPLVLTLKQADERLARYNQPRLERVRRAVAQDLERTRTAGVTDVTVLTIRLDDVIRQVDDLPLLAVPERRGAGAPEAPAAAASAVALPASGAAWLGGLPGAGRDFVDQLWREVRSLVRVTRIEHPEAMLVAPEQAYFLRANLKLRLLNARLALLSRQFDTAQSDLRDALSVLDRYFDRSSRRVVGAGETVRQVMAQSRLVSTPRPDATLAAIAAASAGR
jgi:uroporphyrin-3 C-methyltransferase